MHLEASLFTQYARNTFPYFFVKRRVLDVGAGDINGNNRGLFEGCEWHGNDVTEAPNVTVVSRTKDLEFADESFDTIISTECFEHDPDVADSLQKIVRMLRPGGLFVFTCASTGRREHGTRRSNPNESWGSKANIEDMIDYYKNISLSDLKKMVDLDGIFSNWAAYYNYLSKDLYFWGVKKGAVNMAFHPAEYTDRGVCWWGGSSIPIETPRPSLCQINPRELLDIYPSTMKDIYSDTLPDSPGIGIRVMPLSELVKNQVTQRALYTEVHDYDSKPNEFLTVFHYSLMDRGVYRIYNPSAEMRNLMFAILSEQLKTSDTVDFIVKYEIDSVSISKDTIEVRKLVKIDRIPDFKWETDKI